MGTSERRKEIMRILCRRRHETIRNLAFELGVSERTIRRDVETLSLTEPIYTQTGRYGGGVYVVENYSIIKEHNPDFCEYNLEKSKVVIDEQDDSLFDGMGIEMQGSLITERTIMYSVGGCEVVLDKNTYLGMTDYELEIEYAEENESYAEHIIQNFGQILFSNNMIQEISEFCNRSKSTKSKSARFFERKSFISDNRCPE